MPGIDYTIGAKTSGFSSAIGGAMGKLRGLGSVFAKIAPPVAAIGGIAGLTAGITKAIGKAAELEQLETAFQPLLGSANAAEARIKELSEFAANTPFELPEIARASRTLETLTRGALSTGRGLTLVGDVAAATARPFEEISTTVGRLYDGLQSGRPVGEAMARLQELGVISGETRAQLERLQSEGRGGAEVWAVAEAAMGRFSGGMKLQSGTWNGLMSTLRDNVSLAFAAFGEPIIDMLKPVLEGAIERAKRLGQGIRLVIETLRAARGSGSLAETIGAGLNFAFVRAVNTLSGGIRGSVAYLRETVPGIFSAMTQGLDISGMLEPIKSFFRAIGDGLTAAILSALSKLPGMEEYGDAAKSFSKASAANFDLAGMQMGNMDLGAGFQAALDGLRDAHTKGAQAAAAATRDALIPEEAALEKLQEIANGLPEDLQEKWRDFIANAGPSNPEAAPGTSGGTSGGSSPDPGPDRAARQVQADRLAQIGGYITGGLNAARDRAIQQTERWTRSSAESLKKIAANLAKPPAPTEAPATF